YNGSTADSDSACLGSNPGRVTKVDKSKFDSFCPFLLSVVYIRKMYLQKIIEGRASRISGQLLNATCPQALIPQFNPHRRMITGFFPATYMMVHSGCQQTRIEFGTQQKMIYP